MVYLTRKRVVLAAGLLVTVLVLSGLAGLVVLTRQSIAPVTQTGARTLRYDASVSPSEQELISRQLQSAPLDRTKVTAQTVNNKVTATDKLLGAYVVVASPYATRQGVATTDLPNMTVAMPRTLDPLLMQALAQSLHLDPNKVRVTEDMPATLQKDVQAVGIVPVSMLLPTMKLLSLDGQYYLDSFTSGAMFRTVSFAPELKTAWTNTLPQASKVLKINQTGVTALTRELMLKMQAMRDPTYPAKNIGSFLADADITHTSNEVSFKAGCQYSATSFCAQPDAIKTLQASGIDVVELTGNHNNDAGGDANTATINTYNTLGLSHFGGGINAADASKPYIADVKGMKIAFLGFNYADTVFQSAAIAGTNTPGANAFSFDAVKSAIAEARQQASFVVVDVQYMECYAYPDGYVVFPECYKVLATPDQKADFRHIVDLGADMVVGTQAHQPQTYEMYKNKPIYYGLGNLYFDQTRWPGTEQGIILTHYFMGGKLLQTKLTPTVYDQTMQTRVMTTNEAETLLTALNNARP